MPFLPENYKEPASESRYIKIKKDGEIKIRILSEPIMGWEDWSLEKKPIRFKEDQRPLTSVDPEKPVKFFWSFIVYDIIEHKIKIMQITQVSIRNSLKNLRSDVDFGELYNYDIKIKRTGEGKDTEYHVVPMNIKTIDKSIIDLFDETPCNLEALFFSQDPFSYEWCKHDSSQKKYINKEQLDNFLSIQSKLKDGDKEDLSVTLVKLGIKNYTEITEDTYNLIIPSLIGRIQVTA